MTWLSGVKKLVGKTPSIGALEWLGTPSSASGGMRNTCFSWLLLHGGPRTLPQDNLFINCGNTIKIRVRHSGHGEGRTE